VKSECFKGLENRLFVFGLQPLDIVIILVGFLLIHGTINSLVVDLVYVLLALFLARKTRNRPQGVFVTLFLYFTTPPYMHVPRESEKVLKET